MTATSKHFRRLAFTVAFALAGASTAFGAATSKELLDCQKQFESQLRAFSNVVQTGLAGCAQKIVECALADEIDAVDPTACVAKATASCAGVPAKVGDQSSKRQVKVLAKCGLVSLVDLEPYTAGLGFYNVVGACGAADVNGLVDCVFDGAQCSAEREIFRLDPRAQQSLTTAGIAASFPCVAP
jgi:hypothetical protein